MTAAWYKVFMNEGDIEATTKAQLQDYYQGAL